MSTFSFFMSPSRLFETLAGLTLKFDTLRVILRGFSPEHPEPGFVICSDLMLGEGEYSKNAYSEIYLSIGGIPRARDEWGFTSRCANDLIIIEGCRLLEDSLEIANARLFSKKSDAKSVFRSLRRRVLQICAGEGCLHLQGTPYPDIKYDPTVVGLFLMERFGEQDESWRYSIEG